MSTPAVSWLLCSHVADVQLDQAIQSCLTQTFDDFELVFVANGPSAVEIAAHVSDRFGADPRVRSFSTSIHHLTFSLSLGLHHCRAPLVARMDGDDLSYPSRLELQVRHMAEWPDVAVLGTAYDLIDAHDQVLKRVSPPRDDAAIRRALVRGNPICHPSVMFRRAVVVEAGGYLGSVHAQDYDLWTRIASRRNCRFANLPDAYVRYRNEGVGVARRSRRAYAAVASAQWRCFVEGAGLQWAGAALLSAAKGFLLSRTA